MRPAKRERRQPRPSFALCLGVFLFLTALASSAHDHPNAKVPSFPAVKVDVPLNVDGVLDEPFWSQCPVASGLIDQRTQRPADQQTLIRVAYTRTHLYLAVECLDDKISEIHATERREDRSFVGDDWVEIHFDPQHSHRGKYAFFTNPLGTRADANEGPSGEFNYGWSAEWDLAAKILADRWVFEMRIPFSVLNYLRKDAQSWGFNVTRALRRSDVTSFWSFSATDVYKPRHFGHLTGLDLADTKFSRNWEVTPYASVRTDFNGDTDTFFQTGVDVSFRLSPSVTTAWTINPDYGQVESDADTIELRDTERFLPERRPFFREGEELIRMTHRLYYSRRFTDIDAGAKISGQWPHGKFVFLDLLGDTTRDNLDRYGNSTILRVLQDVKERSSLGYYVADSELEDGHSRVVSADGYFFLTDALRFSFQGSAADDFQRGETGTKLKDSRDFLGSSSLIYSTYPWYFSAGYQAITEEFNPLLGYIPRQNIFGPSFFGEYHPKSEARWYKELGLSCEGEYYETADGHTSVRDQGINGSLVFQNDVGLRAGYGLDYHAPYHNSRTRAGFSLFTSDFWKSVNVGWAGGTFEDTDYNELFFTKPIKPWERLPIQYEFTVRFENRPDGTDGAVWLNRIVFDLYLRKNMWIKTSLQNRNDALHNYSVIYGWEFRRNAWWYLVYNDVTDDLGPGKSIFTKITYTFR